MHFHRLIDAFDFQVAVRGGAIALTARSDKSGEWITSTWIDLDRIVRERSESFPVHCVATSATNNSFEQVVDMLAIMRSGAVEVCVDHHHVTDASLPANAALVLQTSGTTSTPRGVVLTHQNLLGNAAAKLSAVPQSSDDVRLTVLPLSHAYARTCDFGTWLLSGCEWAVTLGFAGLLDLASRVRPTLMNVVPSIAYRLLAEPAGAIGLERLRLLGCGGAAISSNAFEQFATRGVTVIQGYGLTETGPVICSATPHNATAGLVGDFVHGWQHQIRGGELFVRGPHVMHGYWGDESATRAKIDSEGWLRTGDLIERDAATGQLRILGRVDDVLVMDNGRKISPSRIEREVEQIAGVEHALLLWRGRLELWIDGTAEESSVLTLLDKHPHCRSVTLSRFATPLSVERGELTVKGTIRRARIISNRFGKT